ncbi:carbohydrate ABC transporter permease [Kineococcus rhizosphaerae]|uniref:Carbohydrate ABC transporter membrane protein 1 (CUT1 family) n=1 Tax=Kineococcus rhizosphaerae TaxID=559628 RepID=A0A2T0QXD6_9ACTN|nr:sugar ABC transporter permease [Kineococcus rhizosphaerae]PRY10542.1 carbohydrate ABC transporter membrane protein 1 (CUT1 family) [Kineococcus rhizosphaerae]
MSASAPGSVLTAAPGGAPPPRRRRRSSAAAAEERAAYVFLLPWFLGLLFTVVPFGVSLYLAFTDYNLLQSPQLVGLENFTRVFDDPKVSKSASVTFGYTFLAVPISMVTALAVAVLLNKGVRGLKFYRSVFYLPSLIGASVAIVMLWRSIFGYGGIVNSFLGFLGIDGPGWVTDPDWALVTLVTLSVWGFGASMVIFLAGLRQIPVMYYEAASVDGAGWWRQFRSITLPLLSPVIFFNLVLGLIGSLQTFTQGFVFSGGTGGPAESTLFYNLYLYQQGFQRFDMGYASALAWVMFIVIAFFTALNFLVSKYWVFYDD